MQKIPKKSSASGLTDDVGYEAMYNNLVLTTHYHDIPKYDIALNPQDMRLVCTTAAPNLKSFADRMPSPNCFGRSISLYGVDPKTKTELGHPIADSYLCLEYKNAVVLVVADGCGWGNAPSKAAQDAILGFQSKIVAKLLDEEQSVKDTREVAHHLLLALLNANLEVFKGAADPSDERSAGTTTLLGGVVVKLNARSGTEPFYGFVGLSLGDCKVYRVSMRSGIAEVSDPSKGALRGADAADPGGRLGPANYQRPKEPDLRNLQLLFVPLEPGDFLCGLSDGVHDNLDPVILGEWDEKPANGAREYPLAEIDAFKALRAEKLLRRQSELTSESITRACLQHCTSTLRALNEFMATSKHTGRLQTDYKTYPGKQDHATCVVYRLCEFGTTSASERLPSPTLARIQSLDESIHGV